MSELLPVDIAIADYLTRWHADLIGTTKGVEAFAARSPASSLFIASGRMIDDAQAMLDSLRRNNTDTGLSGANQGAKFPCVISCTGKDYVPTTADWAAKHLPKQQIQIEPNGSWYEYQQAMCDIRWQLAIFADERQTASSLAAQFHLFMAQPSNKRFKAKHTFGQYEVHAPIMIESPEPSASNVVIDGQRNITCLAIDVTLKVVIPYFRAPKLGDPNDNSANSPQGFPVVIDIYGDNWHVGV